MHVCIPRHRGNNAMAPWNQYRGTAASIPHRGMKSTVPRNHCHRVVVKSVAPWKWHVGTHVYILWTTCVHAYVCLVFLVVFTILFKHDMSYMIQTTASMCTVFTLLSIVPLTHVAKIERDRFYGSDASDRNACSMCLPVLIAYLG